MLQAARSFLKGLQHLEFLSEELCDAEVVAPEALPEDVATIHSTVCITELPREHQDVYMLVLPPEAKYNQHHISVLSPLGAALLGARKGEVVETKGPTGEQRFRVDVVRQKAKPKTG
jgi:regulator of nucleoside diphosphate kinase